jgi:adenine-specific DNA-methyltransferase
MSDTKLLAVRESLGEPSFERAGLHVYRGDCVELLSRLPAGLIDLTVTSPPYNIGKQYESELPLGDYVEWCHAWIRRIYRATSATGAFWLNVGYLPVPGKAKALPIPYLLWDRVEFFLMQEIIWNYGAGVASQRSFSPRNEKFLWYVKDADQYTFDLDSVRDPNVKYPNQKKNGKLKCNPLGKNPTDVWEFPKVTSGANRSSSERTPHPAQFPVAVIDRIVRACSRPGDLILDPFLGSGTVAEVAIRNGRHVLGFEIREDYVAIARERIDSVIRAMAYESAQQKLF